MSTLRFNNTVSSQEAEALKEMIFKRARERAEALNNETQKAYTNNVQSEIMNLARESFVTSKNPFNKTDDTETKEEQNTTDKDREIGFAKRQVKEIKNQISYKNNDLNTEIANAEVNSTMKAARAGLEQRQNFIGALDFLNSQATIALIKNKNTNFDAIA